MWRSSFLSSVAVSGVSAGDIAQFTVAKPPVAEQDAAMAILSAALRRVNDEAAEAHKLRTLKHGLMDDLLTGRVRTVTDGGA